MNDKLYDVIIVGAGAAGLMAASQAGHQGKKVLLLESTNKIGEKIRISGGGKCNFTNLYTSPKNYLSDNPHFAISALARYTQHDFINLVAKYKIAYHEKTLGQLFCDGSSQQIIHMLIEECRKANVTILLNCSIYDVRKSENFYLNSNLGEFSATSLIIASGGLSIPKIGASDFGYRIASQFKLNIVTPRPALVPLAVNEKDLTFFRNLSGISIDSIVHYKNTNFRENILFTHRGLSGPAILQISSYIKKPNEIININLLPDVNLKSEFLREKNSKMSVANFLKNYLPNRFLDEWCSVNAKLGRLVDYKLQELEKIAEALHNFKVCINGTEGYLKAEVTTGGVDTKELSSKTMAALKIPNLYFIGEIVDVTGWLGGYNFQWAWSSGYVAGRSI